MDAHRRAWLLYAITLLPALVGYVILQWLAH